MSPRAGQEGHPCPWRVAEGSGMKPDQQTLFRRCGGNARSKASIGRDAWRAEPIGERGRVSRARAREGGRGRENI